MADETWDQKSERSMALAEELLALTGELSAGPMIDARKIVGPGAEEFAPAVQLEIAAAMAMERVLRAHMRAVLPEIEKLQERPGRHAMQSVVNPLVGGFMAYTRDMPPPMRSDMLALFMGCLADAEVQHAEIRKRMKRHGAQH